MFIITGSLLLLLLIHPGELARTATAVLYRDGTNTTIGTLTIFQNNSNTPVFITGSVSQLNTSATLVNFIEKKIKSIFELFILF